MPQPGKQFRKRPRDASDSDNDELSTGIVRQAAPKRANIHAASSSATFGDKSKDVLNSVTATYISDKTSAPHKYGGDAFATNEIDGPAGAAAPKTSSFGPIRAPTNVRGICRIDYQPDICKDYKETGYCGFGDSCIYLHDRGDYKAGWQLEKDWEEKQKAKKAAMSERLAAGMDPGDVDEDNPFLIRDNDLDADEEGLPFACHICRGAFVRPIQTSCEHYFCEPCAVQRYATDPHCAICGKQTHGIFNHAAKLAAKIRARKEADGEVKDDDDAHAMKVGKPVSNGWSVVDDDDNDDDGGGQGKQSSSADDKRDDKVDSSADNERNVDADDRQYITTFSTS